MRGESPGGLDTELYGETNEKDSWGPRSLWPTRRFRVNSREVGYSEVIQFDGLSPFRPCGRDLVAFFNCTVWAFTSN